VLVRRALSLRGIALVPAAALALDHLRYLLAYRTHAGNVFEAEGHDFLGLLVPWIGLAVAVAIGAFLARLVRVWRGARADEGSDVSGLALWATCSGLLLAIHILQEALELLLIPGNTGLYVLLGTGMVWAALAAIAVGGALALALRGARALIVRASRRRRAGLRQPACAPRLGRPRSVSRLLVAPLAGSAAGRAPPALAPPAA
jgi:hypothetical protein